MTETDSKIFGEKQKEFVITNALPAPMWVRAAATLIRRLPAFRYRLINILGRRPPAEFLMRMPSEMGAYSFNCDLRDDISREVCFSGWYEPQETTLVQAILRPGMCFVDVGANWGYFTLIAAYMVSSTGRIVSFEPHPALYSTLEDNIKRNRLEWVTPLQVAVADREGEMNLAGFIDDTTGNRGISRLTMEVATDTPNFRVQTGLLEALLDEQGIVEVDLLKIDVEGGEALVLPTLREGFSRARYKRILLELHPAALKGYGVSSESLIEELLNFGYRAWHIDHSPAAFRRAAYRFTLSPGEFLVPFDSKSPLDSWPHLLFTAPNVEPPL